MENNYSIYRAQVSQDVYFIADFNPQSALKVTHHAGHTLKHFCRWASLINPKSEEHPNHHDIAVLITRYV